MSTGNMNAGKLFIENDGELLELGEVSDAELTVDVDDVPEEVVAMAFYKDLNIGTFFTNKKVIAEFIKMMDFKWRMYAIARRAKSWRIRKKSLKRMRDMRC